MAGRSPSSPNDSTPGAASVPALTPVGRHAGKTAIPLTRPVVLIGSRSSARVHLVSSSVSKAHALLVRDGGSYYIHDLASREHVFVNGEQVTDADLNDGDLVKIGSFTFKFTLPPDSDRLSGGWNARDREELPSASLDSGSHRVALDQRMILIGRRSGSEFPLQGDAVSTSHAVVFEMEGKRYIRDLGSRSGTQLNGKTIHQAELEPGDRISIGGNNLRYVATTARPTSIDAEKPEAPVVVAAAPPSVESDEVSIPELEDAPLELDLENEERLPLNAMELVREEQEKQARARAKAPEIEIPDIEPKKSDDDAIEIEEKPPTPRRAAKTELIPPPLEPIAPTPAPVGKETEVILPPLEDEPPAAAIPAAKAEEEAAAPALDEIDLSAEAETKPAPEPISADTAEIPVDEIEALADETPAVEEAAPVPAASTENALDALDLSAAEEVAEEPSSEIDRAAEVEAQEQGEPELELDLSAPEAVGRAPETDEAPGAADAPELTPRGGWRKPAAAETAEPVAEDDVADVLSASPLLDDDVEADERPEPVVVDEPIALTDARETVEETDAVDETVVEADEELVEPAPEIADEEAQQAEAAPAPEAADEVVEEGTDASVIRFPDSQTDEVADVHDDMDDDAGASVALADDDAASVDETLATLDQDSLDAESAPGALAEDSGELDLAELETVAEESPEALEETAEVTEIEVAPEAEPELAVEEPAEEAIEPLEAAEAIEPVEAAPVAEFVDEQPVELTAAHEAEAPEAAPELGLAFEAESEPAPTAEAPAQPVADLDLSTLNLDVAEHETSSPEAELAALDLADELNEPSAPTSEEIVPLIALDEQRPSGEHIEEPLIDASALLLPPIAGEPFAPEDALAPIIEIAPTKKSRRPRGKKKNQPVAEAPLDTPALAEALPETTTPAEAPPAETAAIESEAPAAEIGEIAPTKKARRPRGKKKSELVVETPLEAPAVSEAVPEMTPPAEAPSAEPLAIEPEAPAAEIVEPTQSTPESALDLTPLETVEGESSSAHAETGSGLTDSTFGRAVEEFSADLEPLVEAARAEETPAEMSLETSAEAEAEIELEPIAEAAQVEETVTESSAEPEIELEPVAEAAPVDEEAPAEIALEAEAPSDDIPEAAAEIDLSPLEVVEEVAPEAEASAELEPEALDLSAEEPSVAEADAIDEIVDELPPEESVVEAPSEPEPAALDLSADELALEALAEEESPAAPDAELEEIADEVAGDESELAEATPVEVASAEVVSDEAEPIAPLEDAPTSDVESVATESASPVQEPIQSPSPMMPFLGLGTDQANFLGGMPLRLDAAAQNHEPTFAQVPGGFGLARVDPEELAEIEPAEQDELESESESDEALTAQSQDATVETEDDMIDAEIVAESDDAQASNDAESAAQTQTVPPDEEGSPDQLQSLIAPQASPTAESRSATPAARDDASAAPAGRASVKSPTVRSLTPPRLSPRKGESTQQGKAPADPFSIGLSKATPAIPPYKGPAQRKGARPLTTAFDGLAGIDVFSHGGQEDDPNDAAHDLLAADGGDSEGASPSPLTPRGGRGSGKSITRPSGEPEWRGLDPSHFEESAEPRRRMPSVPVLLLLMILAGVGAAAAIWYFVPPRVRIEGKLSFANVESTPNHERNMFLEAQARRILSPAVRDKALEALGKKSATLRPGFLSDEVVLSRIVDTVQWPDDKPGTMVISYTGDDGDGDPVRVAALLQGIYEANRNMSDSVSDARARIKQCENAVNETQQMIDKLAAQIDALRSKANNRPSANRMDELRKQAASDEKAWNEAVAAVKEAEVELGRLTSAAQLPTTAPGDSSSAAPADASASAAAADEQSQQIQKQIEAVNEKIAAARKASDEQAETARKQLDVAAEQLQKELADAQTASKDSPELAAYVTSAQKLQEQARQLTSDLIHSQQENYNRLSTLKRKLDEKLEARRNQTWDSDKELKELREKKAIAERQYNVAKSEHLAELPDRKADLDYLSSATKARQELLGDDSFYAEAIKQIQEMIDATQKQMEADRKRTDEVLDSLQKSLAAAAPGLEKLPAEQKALRESVDKRLAEMSAARKQYALAAEAKNAEANAELKKLEDQSAALSAKLDDHRLEVAAQQKQKGAVAAASDRAQAAASQAKLIEIRQTALAAAKQTETRSRETYFSSAKELRQAESDLADARNADEISKKLSADSDAKLQELTLRNNQLEQAKESARKGIEPIAPDETSVKRLGYEDPRKDYAFASTVGIVVIFGLLMLVSSLHGSRSSPPPMARLADQEEAVAKEPEEQSGGVREITRGNATARTAAEGDEEDHEALPA